MRKLGFEGGGGGGGGKCNFINYMYVACVLNIGLLPFPLLIDPCFLPF